MEKHKKLVDEIHSPQWCARKSLTSIEINIYPLCIRSNLFIIYALFENKVVHPYIEDRFGNIFGRYVDLECPYNVLKEIGYGCCRTTLQHILQRS